MKAAIIGPVVVACIGIELVDTLTASPVGDTLLPGPLLFDALRTDTLEVELRFDP